ncbi:DUF302 domain-containing protein [Sphingomonas sp. BN140010]|uniref:DUF302 domain-containing protein n=1 Tax=Sphingomonas arvum TaxID=2992113 RepID=A0ABT3JEH5_9SPHN|nr:DUF302 domain-containing protein [Sphingomonas sp. BN140010]MCW3797216.1 DUF302 domain-containing protein [Sphingomonas sp. BN140010]
MAAACRRPDYMTPVPGLIVRRSTRSFAEALAGAVGALQRANVPLLATIDHSKTAAKAGLSLRPTTVLIFGNPKGGTPLMRVLPTSAIELPLKLLVWEDPAAGVWLAADDPEWIAERHGSGAPHPELIAPLQALTEQVLLSAA